MCWPGGSPMTHLTNRADDSTKSKQQRPTRTWAAMSLLMGITACAQCAPDRVGPGVARLAIRNVGAMATLLSNDTNCGFASPAVLAAATMKGDIGGPGTLTMIASACTIDAGDGLEVSKDCRGVTTTARGKVTLTAKRTLKGLLTGNPASPIIPSGPDAVSIVIENATYENFFVEKSSSKNKLRMTKGSLSAVVSPRLAVSATSGACAISTPHAAFSDVIISASSYFVETADNKFDVDVDDSNLDAQNGVNGTHANELSGTVTVWGTQVPAEQGDYTIGLDPEYDTGEFEESYACTPDLAKPVSFTCADLKPQLAGGVARLSVRALGTITSMIESNSSCGFSSLPVLVAGALSGDVGKDGASIKFTLSAPCEITLPANTLLSTDCAGTEVRGSGKVSVVGTKTVTGIRTGNPLQPIIPTSWQPAQFDLTATLTNFEVKNSTSTSSMLIRSATLAGKVTPRTSIDKDTGACSIATPVVTFSDLDLSSAKVLLASDGNHFDLTVGSSDLSAQNGTMGTVSNSISGSILMEGESFALAAAGEPLDTAFEQSKFDASYACTPKLVVAPSDEACSFRQPLGIAAARLLVKSFATATSMLDKNATCGFKATSVLGSPTDLTGTPGNPGSVTWAATDCVMGPLPPDGVTIATNCVGAKTNVGGWVTASATKTVVGWRSDDPLFFKPIIPKERDAATLNVTQMAFTDMKIYDLAAGETTAAVSSTLNGSGSVTVKPIAGEHSALANVYSISTPVAGIESLTMATGSMSIQNGANHFILALTDVSLNAFNGSYDGHSNELSGSMKVDGHSVTISATALVPTFDQTAFNATYACTPDLKEVIPYP